MAGRANGKGGSGKRVSMAQVARAAGVSPTTASLVLGGRGEELRIAEETVDRVRHAARELGYQGSYHARTLAKGRSMTLGYTVWHFERDPFTAAVGIGIAQSARDLGYEVLHMPADKDTQEVYQRGLDYLEQGRIDGLIVFLGPGALWHHRGMLQRAAQLPVVHLWFDEDCPTPLIIHDPEPGIRAAFAELAEQGHRRLLYWGVRRQQRILTEERLRIYRRVVAEYPNMQLREVFLDMPEEQLRHGYRIGHYFAAMQGHLDCLEDVTAVVAYNDRLAAALSMHLQYRGVSVPDEVSLIGFDDLDADQGLPPLSTISLELDRMGSEAVRALHAHLDGRRLPKVMRLPCRWIARGSHGPATRPSAGG